jgi:tetratricopeptide (TPR) repeat protein
VLLCSSALAYLIFMRCVFCFLLLAAAAPAQVPDKFTNLQVFPKDISSKDLISTMRGFCFSLGVRCEYCHANKNFASDEIKNKTTARNMLRMVAAINRDFIPKESSVRVECVTCHHGLSRPRTIQAVLLEDMEKSDVTSAISLYRKLRKETYGSGQYDFSETSLNLLSETLVHGGKPKEAAAFMELNLEVNSPLSNWAYSDFAMAHLASGESQKAEADFRRILEADPQNSWAKEELEKLRKRR